MTILALLVAALAISLAQEKGLPQLSPTEVPLLEIDTTRVFTGKALYGYIDGGAELYLEYGFDRVIAQEVRLRGEPYRVEVFRMADPPAALGIFTVSRGHGYCAQLDSLSRFSCSTSYSVQWARSNYFVRVANSSGSPAAQAGGIQLACLISKKIPGDQMEIPAIVAAAGESPGALLFVRGVLGMQNGFDDWSSLVDGLEGFEAYLVIRQDSSGQTVGGDFRFRRDSDIGKFKSAFSRTGKFIRFQEKSNRRIIVLESDTAADSLWSRLVKLP